MILLKQFRQKRRMTQVDLEHASGISQQIISKIENGDTKNPGVFTMLDLADALRCTVDDLVTRDKKEASA